MRFHQVGKSIRIVRQALAWIIVTAAVQMAFAQTPAGVWTFDDPSNPTNAAVGIDLVLVGSVQPVNGPASGNGAVTIGPGSYLRMTHGMASNGDGNLVNSYTVQFDFRVASTATWHCFFQTLPSNASQDDGDCFINPTGNIGVGVTGYTPYAIKPQEWYRLVISVQNSSHYKYYLDGQLALAGTAQPIDGRFALNSVLLLFADNDGEDGAIDCAEVAVWNRALTSTEAASLGGYGHVTGMPDSRQLVLTPYLQAPSTHSMIVCWHDTIAAGTAVEYGPTRALGLSIAGTSELIAAPYRWHSVTVDGLQSNTEYFYRAVSGSGASDVYSFRTLPDDAWPGTLRFLVLGDTHSGDTTAVMNVLRAARKKTRELYGDNPATGLHAVLHSGDLVVSGGTISQWTDQYLAPMSVLSPFVPFLTVAGNHEGEHRHYYAYMKQERLSAFPASHPLHEKTWSWRVANTKVIGLNSNIANAGGAEQIAWLDQELRSAEADSTLDFVIVLAHHFAVTELWGEGMSHDAGPAYVANQVIPTLKKYAKVAQLSYGHTHGFERGTVESESGTGGSDFRMVCGGGGGGALDRWGTYKNTDFPSIQVALDHHFFQIIEINAGEQTFSSAMYSLGNTSNIRDAQVMDTWYIKPRQAGPDTPVAYSPICDNAHIMTHTSRMGGGDSLMTVRFSLSDDPGMSSVLLDTMIHSKNVHGVDAGYEPRDLQKGLDMTRITLPFPRFDGSKTYYYRVRYRDHNLRWSAWSNIVSFNVPTLVSFDPPRTYNVMEQNFPNPFNPTTRISFTVPEGKGNIPVMLEVSDHLGRVVATLVHEPRASGTHTVSFGGERYPSGLYYCRIRIGTISVTKKMMLVR